MTIDENILVNGIDDYHQMKTPPHQHDDDEDEKELKKLDLSNTPCIDSKVFDNLPDLLKNILTDFMGNENERIKDIVLLSSITSLSACMPNVRIMYDGDPHYPNLYMGIFAKSRSGKGSAKYGTYLTEQIDIYIRERSIKLREEMDNDPESNDKEHPPIQGLLCPSDVTTAMLTTLAGEWEKGGVFISTGEIKTLTGNKAGGHTNHDSFFLSSYHHERYGVGRKTTGKGGEREIFTIEKPKLTILATGVKSDIGQFFEDEKSGLFQRFCIYTFDKSVKIMNPLLDQVNGVKDIEKTDKSIRFKDASFKVLELYKKPEKWVYFTMKQTQALTYAFMQASQEKYKRYYGGDDMEATVITFGVIVCRIASIFCNLRRLEAGYKDNFNQQMECSDKDFFTALSIGETLMTHSQTVFDTFTNTDKAIAEHKAANSTNLRRSKLLKAMPQIFSTKDWRKWATENDYKERSVGADITKLEKSGALRKLDKDGQLNRWEKVI
jgi:hypothetical protein